MRRHASLIAWAFLVALAPCARAGMASPLPEEPLRRYWLLHDTALARLQAISLFLLVFLLCAAALQLLWNYVRRDFPALPRLSFGRAVAGVFLWALVFVIVLAMIAGARELMTPGAWEKQGYTYRLADRPGQAEAPDPETVRRQHLEKLRLALWQFAATHNGHFPDRDEASAIPRDLWEVPEAGGMQYLYVAGLSAGHLPQVLAYEPDWDPERRLVLRTNGDILTMGSAEIIAVLNGGKKP